MPISPRTVATVRDRFPDAQIFEGGPARNKALDREHSDALEQTLGGVRVLREYARNSGASVLNFMEADWAATSVGIHYVNFNAGIQRVWEWSRLVSVTAAGKVARLELESGANIELHMSEPAATSLARIAMSMIGRTAGGAE